MATIGRASRELITLLIILQVLLTAVVVGGSLNHVHKMRTGALDTQVTEVASAVQRAEEQLTQTLYLIGLTLTNLDELSGFRAGEPEPEVQQRLAHIKRQMPVLRSLSFADSEGRIVASSVPSNVGRHLDLASLVPHMPVERPLVVRIGTPWEGRDFGSARQTSETDPADWRANTFIPVAVSLEGDDIVLAVATVNPDFFLNRFGAVSGKTEVLLSAVNYDGITLLTNETDGRAGSRSPDSIVLDGAIERTIGQRVHHVRHDEPGVLAYRASRNYPLVVIGHQAHDVALATWRHDARLLLITAGSALLLTLVTIGYLMRRIVLAQERETRYQESQRLAARLFERSNDGVIITDAATRILAANTAFERITGYNTTEALGQTPRLLSSGLHDKAFYQRMWQSVLEEDEWHGEITNRRKDGSLFSEWLSILTMRDADGMVSGYIGLICDLSELKRNQQLIRQLSTAVEQSPSSIVITTLEPAIEYVNPFFTRITGYEPEEVIGKNPRILQSSLTPEHVYREMWARLEAGETWQGEFINKRKDGTHYHEYATLSPIRDATGKVVRYLGIKHDISERVKLERELREAKEGAEAANLSKSAFLANMSHEIRTPLNGVLGMAQLLVTKPDSDPQTRDYARTILHSGQSLLHLLNDILDLSKIEAGRMTLEKGVVMPGELLHEVEMLFASNARDKGLAFTTRLEASSLPRYRGDPHRLAQMLGNLVSNAIKFTHRGGVTVEARALPGQEPGWRQLEFSVSDTGIGVPEDKRSMLFKPFTQVDGSATREFGGTGLGLSIVSKLAHSMGGEVGVQSDPGQGSRFWFRVPLEAWPDDHDSRDSAREPIQTADGPSAGGLRGRVLVAEDHADNQVVIRAMLEHLGLACVLESDGERAVSRFEQEAKRIDAVLMDVHMPVLDGLAATARIRELEHRCSLAPKPIIAMTASAFAEDRERCLDAGMDDYLSKPLDMARLASTLEHWLSAPETPVPLPPETGAKRSLDVAGFRRQIDAIMPLLAASRFDALQQFSALESLARNTPLEAHLAAIRPSVEAFQFSTVGDRLTELLDDIERNRSPEA